MRTNDPFDRFDERFDKQFDRMDKMMDHPVRSVLSVWLIGIILSLLFWGTLIVGTIWAVSHFLL